jgi:hypothetical protein
MLTFRLVINASKSSHAWSGKSWAVVSLPGPSSAKWALSALAPDGKGGTWALAQASNRESGRIWHLSGHAWSIVKPDFGKHAWILTQLAAVPHTESVWSGHRSGPCRS